MRLYLISLPSLLLTACMVQESQYQETHTVYFNGSGNTITETTTGNYQGTAPITGYASLATSNVNIQVTGPTPPPITRYNTNAKPYYQENIRRYTDGNTTITRGEDVIIGGCVHTITRHGQTYQIPMPCPER